MGCRNPLHAVRFFDYDARMAHSTRPPSAEDLNRLADHAIQFLEQERMGGLKRVELSEDARAALLRPAAAPARAPAQAAPSGGGASDVSSLADIAREIAQCVKCPLHKTRTRTVPGQGNPRAELMFIGEGPGFEEDRQGLAFVGRAGELLSRLIVRMGFTRDEVFIANIVKCRPTENGDGLKDRKPSESEMQACLPYLRRQIAAIRPRAIVALGATAVEGLIGLTGISKLRGTWREYEGIPLMPTFHPSYLLRGGGDERERYWQVWDDMLKVLEKLGRQAPTK